uniref:Uncharacterized protein n=1 Tax=Rhizophora mucronata TaxID=61149 RepID=A0A2P2LVN4_RHIMU
MAKLATGNPGSLFVSLLEKISITYKNLSCQPCFLELVAKYSQQGYRYVQLHHFIFKLLPMWHS